MKELACAVCLYAITGRARSAITIIEGYAVCEKHMGLLARGENFAAIKKAAGS